MYRGEENLRRGIWLEDLGIDGKPRGRLICLKTCGWLVWKRGFFLNKRWNYQLFKDCASRIRRKGERGAGQVVMAIAPQAVTCFDLLRHSIWKGKGML